MTFVDTLSSSKVLNIRYSYSFFRVKWTSPSNQGFDLTSLGLPSSFANQLQKPALFGNYAFTNYSPIGWFANVEDTGTRALEGSISKAAGKHNIRAGWDLRLTHFTFINPGAYTFTSAPDFTSTDWSDTGSQTTSGDSFATFLLGTPSSGNTTINANQTISSYYIAPWIQEDWKATSNLTINLGFRWDILTPPVDKYNALNIGFDPNIPNAVQSQIPSSAYTTLPQTSNLTGGLLFAGVGSNPRGPYSVIYHNVQPRIGMAWSATKNLVVRGGYGIFYTNFPNNAMIQQNGFSTGTPLTTSTNGGQTSIANVLNNPYPTGLIQPSGSTLGTMTGLGQNLSTYNRTFKIPNVLEFSFGLQYRVAANSVIDASYVGNRGKNTTFTYDQNMPSWAFQQTCDEIYANGQNQNCTKLQASPFQNVAGFAGTSYFTNATQSAYNLARPHPQFQAVTTDGLNRGGNWYNALQLNFRQRLTHGLTLNTSYVWSKQILQTGWLNQALNLPQRSVYNRGLPHSFKIQATYELPIGRGKLINLQNKVVDSLLGGWRVSPDFTFQSGEPATLPTNAIPLPHNKFRTNLDWHANQVQAWGNCVLTQVNGVRTIPGGTSGTMAQRCGTDFSLYDWVQVPVLANEVANRTNASFIHMKPTIASDLAVEKIFKLERVSLTVRGQATNVLNHFNLLTARFDINPADGANFGTVFPGQTPTADSPPRNLNLQFKASF